ncbi:MAG: Cfr10I/Bse634I family restriction endonuclease [Spirulina sp.]
MKEESKNNSPFRILRSFQDKIFFPSPDYILAQIENDDLIHNVQTILEKQAREPNCLDFYNFLENNLSAREIKAIFSLKTSHRPDRRYQPLFEAATIKAMAYLLKQDWKYYMIVSDLPEGDRLLFARAISPHGIAVRQNIKLVDGAYLYNSKSDLQPLIFDAVSTKD